MKKIILVILSVLAVLSLFIFACYSSYSSGLRDGTHADEKYRAEIEQETIENNPIPECNYGNCPTYQAFDVDGDGKPETIALERLGMTQFAGRIYIIDDGSVVFLSKRYMRIRLDPIQENLEDLDSQNGFIISYSTVANSNSDVQRDYYKYVDGEYILEKSEK